MRKLKKKNVESPVISVLAKSAYIADQSNPDQHTFVWSYEITISNEGPDIIQVLNRHWRIIDMNGKIEEVFGVGVVGLQPIIKPGKSFQYLSFCHLTTPQGVMEGAYELQNLDEQHFSTPIPKFILSAPSSITKLFKSRLH